MINKRIDRAWSEAYNSNNYIKKLQTINAIATVPKSIASPLESNKIPTIGTREVARERQTQKRSKREKEEETRIFAPEPRQTELKQQRSLINPLNCF